MDLNKINGVMRTDYYDLYDSKKEYTKLLFRPGKVAQSREMNEIQSVFLDLIKRFGDSILRDGSIIEGCSVVIKEKSVIISKGKVYLEGVVREVSETKIDIEGIGVENVGVQLYKNIITDVEDPTLRDPAESFANYSQSGADRLKESVIITVNDASSANLYILEDGELLISNEEQPFDNKIFDMIARRTFDESGNYVVEGFKLSDKGIFNEDNIFISLESGKAYISGYEVYKPTSSTIKLEKSISTRTVLNEPKIYRSDITSFALNSHPVKEVKKVVSIVEVEQNITRGNIGSGLDYLPKTPVVSIVEVKSGAKVYKPGLDYRLTSDGVDWSPSGEKPSIGSSYSVTWTYNKIMESGIDYNLVVNKNQSYIEFIGSNTPVQGTSFLLDYSFYLARQDLITIDRNGRINIIKGQPDIERLVLPPSNNNNDLLQLGIVLLPANGNTPVITNKTISAISMSKLHDLMKRIEDVEYNQAINDLDDEAIASEPASQLKGILTDSFLGFSKCDLGHDDFSTSMDILSQELLLPQTSFQYIPNIKEESKSKITGRVVTAPFMEMLSISQPSATEIMRINPYEVFPNRPSLFLNPTMDNWIDEKIIETQGKDVVKTINVRNIGQGRQTTVTNSSVTTKILNEAITFMRQIEVKIEADKFPAYADKICGVFDGVSVPLTAQTNIYTGSEIGTLKADGNGHVKASFMIPDNIPTGTKELSLFSKNMPNLIASAQFTAKGVQKTTFNTVFREIITLVPIDPLAQSFSFENDRILTSIGVFFADKDEREKVSIQIRGLTNGFPNSIVYGEKILSPNEIKVSTDSLLETKIKFTDPVYCKANEQYCIVILSESDVASVFISTLGDKDINTKQQILRQPYSVGVLFSSSNAITWTPHQTQDLKFNVYTAKFENNGLIEFTGVSVKNIDRVLLCADFVTPTGTKIEWEYQANSEDWFPIAEFSELFLNKKVVQLSLRAKIIATDYLSPTLALDTFCLIGYVTGLAGSYVSRNVSMPTSFTTVKQVVDLALPAGTTVNMKFATDTNGENWRTIPNVSVEPIDHNYSRYTFSETVEASSNFRCRLDLGTNDQCLEPKVKRLINILK